MPEQVIEGRLFDVQGQPVPGVVVSVSGILRDLPPVVLSQGRVIEPDSDEVYRWWGRVQDGPGWPKPATTDAEGRFTLHGIGRGLHARLNVLDPRFAPQTIEIATDAPAGVMTLKAALLPARTITGRVTYADNGRTAAHAEVHVAGRGGQGGITYIADRMSETDNDGRFRLSPMPGDRLEVWAAAPDGLPYFHAAEHRAWPKGATEQAVDLALPRGVLIHGNVSEEGTGQPVGDAIVSFRPYGQRSFRAGGGWAPQVIDMSSTARSRSPSRRAPAT